MTTPSGPEAGVSTATPDFTALPDLASRALAGSVVHANDELFAERENLIRPEPAVFAPGDFGHKGKTYDGWETRRRREPGSDHAIVRLGVAGVVRGVVVDTAWFRGNYPPFASVEAAGVEGHPSPAELADADWVTLVPRSAIAGDTANAFAVTDGRRLHPRPADDLPRRRGRAVPRPRRAGARPPVPLRHHRPGRPGARRRRRRLLRPVLLLAAQPAAARPGPVDGRGLGERPAPRRRPRPRHGARSARPDGSSGSRSTRRTSSATRPAGPRCTASTRAVTHRPVTPAGSSWCRARGCNPTPATCSASRPGSR